MNNYSFKLSPKMIDFLKSNNDVDVLEGTTSAGKTTIAIPKFMFEVAKSDMKYHVLGGLDTGTVEKNLINSEMGILRVFDGLVKYNGNGTSQSKIPHIEYKTPNGVKIIYVVGYDNKKRWQKVLGSQSGCLYLDEINTADIEFVREIWHRAKYRLATLNPDDNNMPIYKEFINRTRTVEKWESDCPEEIKKQLCEPGPIGEKWCHWFFTMKDNESLTAIDIQRKINAIPVGTKMYKNKIQGLRGRATGTIFNKREKNVISELTIADKLNKGEIKFLFFSAGCDTSYSKKTHDKLTFEFVGITADKKCIILEEETYNNKNCEIPFAPSDVIPMYYAFLEKCKVKWGFARTAYIDSADQGTISEAAKFKRKTGCIYDFVGAWKKTINVTRIQLQQSWMKTLDFLVCDTCTSYLNELDVYSYDEKGQPEDGNDHSIQGGQYAWLPYKDKIGDWELLKNLIKGAD